MGELSRESDLHNSPRSSVAAADWVVRPSGKMVVSKKEKLTRSFFFRLSGRLMHEKMGKAFSFGANVSASSYIIIIWL